MKVVINKCFGGFGLSDAAYLRLIDLGMPVRAFVKETRNPETGLYNSPVENNGEHIFDRHLQQDDGTPLGVASLERLTGNRFFDCWIQEEGRSHPLVVLAVESLGELASASVAKLRVVEVPDGVDWEIDEYDGLETLRERSRTFG